MWVICLHLVFCCWKKVDHSSQEFLICDYGQDYWGNVNRLLQAQLVNQLQLFSKPLCANESDSHYLFSFVLHMFNLYLHTFLLTVTVVYCCFGNFCAASVMLVFTFTEGLQLRAFWGLQTPLETNGSTPLNQKESLWFVFCIELKLWCIIFVIGILF